MLLLVLFKRHSNTHSHTNRTTHCKQLKIFSSILNECKTKNLLLLFMAVVWFLFVCSSLSIARINWFRYISCEQKKKKPTTAPLWIPPAVEYTHFQLRCFTVLFLLFLFVYWLELLSSCLVCQLMHPSPAIYFIFDFSLFIHFSSKLIYPIICHTINKTTARFERKKKMLFRFNLWLILDENSTQWQRNPSSFCVLRKNRLQYYFFFPLVVSFASDVWRCVNVGGYDGSNNSRHTATLYWPCTVYMNIGCYMCAWQWFSMRLC